MNSRVRAALMVAALLFLAVFLGACSDNNAAKSADNGGNAATGNEADNGVDDAGDDAKPAVFEGELTGNGLQGKDVKVNQVGYLPDARKLAMVEGEGEAIGFGSSTRKAARSSMRADRPIRSWTRTPESACESLILARCRRRAST